MRTAKYLFIVTAASFLVFLAACSAQGNPTPPVAPATAEPADATATIADECAGVPTPSVDVDALIREKLQNHHSIDRVYSANHTRGEWNATLDRMIGYGANISDTEKQQIIDYLVCFHP